MGLRSCIVKRGGGRVAFGSGKRGWIGGGYEPAAARACARVCVLPVCARPRGVPGSGVVVVVGGRDG